ncbi:MAG: hypothetical protein VX622_12850, partial [Pseudomonadota bacterium]|nr:hypothetical protein [Pseudomonadota bacterium]
MILRECGKGKARADNQVGSLSGRSCRLTFDLICLHSSGTLALSIFEMERSGDFNFRRQGRSVGAGRSALA